MIRSRLAPTNLVAALLLTAFAALALFGALRWYEARSAEALPPLSVAKDSAAAAPGALDYAKLYEARKPTVVSIESAIGDGVTNGSGVFVSSDGTIVTASHVVKDYGRALSAASITVRTSSGDELLAQLVAIDQFNDLAVLRVDPRAVTGGVQAAPLVKNSDTAVIGSEVAAIGSPYGNDWSLTRGIVSGLHRVKDSRINRAWKIPDAIQFDAAINKGNSGGPLFNARGEVLGIIQQIETPSEASSGVSFAVSTNIVHRALTLSSSNADIPYAWLGLDNVRTLSPQLARDQKLSVNAGVVVQQAQGPAERAGIAGGTRQALFNGEVVRMGDVITKLAGHTISSSDDLARVAAMLPISEGVEVEIVRGRRAQVVQLIPQRRTI
jgi:S1-C subfamily serine protease